jgi:hypothetical protein
VKEKFPDRRKHSSFWRWVIDMHSAEKGTSWTRWMGTLIISNIMAVWTSNCVFDQGLRINFTFEDMPAGLVAVIATVLVGKVGQSAVEKLGNGERKWRA